MYSSILWLVAESMCLVQDSGNPHLMAITRSWASPPRGDCHLLGPASFLHGSLSAVGGAARDEMHRGNTDMALKDPGALLFPGMLWIDRGGGAPGGEEGRDG